MYAFTLMKSLYFELDKYNIEGVDEWKDKDSTFRRLEVSYDRVPEITSITMELRILPYLDRYYMYVNDGKTEVNIREPQIKQVIYEFYKDHFPDYLRKDLPEDLSGISILDCFEVFNMPDYRPKYAYPGLVTLEDLRAGNVHDESTLHAYPGLEFVGKYKEEKIKQMPSLGGLAAILAGRQRDPGKPTWSDFEGYEEFDGDQNKAISKIEQLKAQYAPAIEGMGVDVDEIIRKSSVGETYEKYDRDYREHKEKEMSEKDKEKPEDSAQN